MSPTTDNGWLASPTLPLRPLVVNGAAFVPGIVDNDDVAYVLGYVVQQVNDRVEHTVPGWCWGFAFRPNVNSPNSLSRHSGGIAVDFNAPAHPNGSSAASSFTGAQIFEIHKILGEVENAVRWGGDFNGTPDAMHFEINVTPAELPAVARRLRNRLEADMPLTELEWKRMSDLIDARMVEFAKTAGETIKVDGDGDPSTPKVSLERKIRNIA